MSTLWVVRHAESLGNVDGSQADTGLSDRGEEQALALRERLAGKDFDQIVTSPLLRARRTAEIAFPQASATTVPDLRELVVQRDMFMDLAGLSREDLLKLAAPSQGADFETGADFVARVRRWLNSLAGNQTILAFTHFAVVRECLRQCGVHPLPQQILHCSVHELEL